jgi:hypothetical protein
MENIWNIYGEYMDYSHSVAVFSHFASARVRLKELLNAEDEADATSVVSSRVDARSEDVNEKIEPLKFKTYPG